MADHNQVVAFGAGTKDERIVTFNAGAPTETQARVGNIFANLLIFFGGGAIFALWIASAYFNLMYMIGFASTWHGRAVWAGFSIAIDVVLALMPIVMKAAFERGERMTWFLAAVILCMALPISWLSGFSYAFSGRDRSAVEASIAINNRSDTSARLAELRRRRELVPDHRPAAQIQADIETVQSDYRYDRSSGCADATLPDSQELCRRYRGLKSEMASAESEARLTGEIDTLQGRLDNIVTTGAASIDDAQAALLSPLTGLKEDVLRIFVSVFLVTLHIIVVTFGPVVILTGAKALKDTYDEPQPPAEPPVTLEPALSPFEQGFFAWAQERLSQDGSGRTMTSQAFSDYVRWAQWNGPYEIPSNVAFGKKLADYCKGMGCIQGGSGGRTAWSGIRIEPTRPQLLSLPKAAQ